MKGILAATDFSTRSQRALRRAGLLAGEFGAALTLVHVVDDDQPDAMVASEQAEAERYLHEQIATMAEVQSTRCKAVVTAGNAFEGILRTATETSAALIVMGRHRKQALRDVIIGTTVERVVRTGPFPVLVVNTAPERPYQHVLGAIDFSPASAHAIKTAQALGLVDGRQVSLLHAFAALAKSKLSLTNAAVGQIEEYVAQEREQAEQALATFLIEHHIVPQSWTRRLGEGEVLDVLTRAIEEARVDLLVVGTHGRTGLAKVLLGSVAEHALRSLDVDILAVPQPR